MSVPALTDEQGRTISDSAKIARWADARGEGPTLFPAALEREIAGYVELSERGLAAGRALSLFRVLGDRKALEEWSRGACATPRVGSPRPSGPSVSGAPFEVRRRSL